MRLDCTVKFCFFARIYPLFFIHFRSESVVWYNPHSNPYVVIIRSALNPTNKERKDMERALSDPFTSLHMICLYRHMAIRACWRRPYQHGTNSTREMLHFFGLFATNLCFSSFFYVAYLFYVAYMISNCNKLVYFLLQNHTPEMLQNFLSIATSLCVSHIFRQCFIKKLQIHAFFVVIVYDFC